MSKNKKSDKAFIEKIKSITIGTGSKPKCPDCGGDLKVIPFVAAGIIIPLGDKPEEAPESKKPTEETSFAA